MQLSRFKILSLSTFIESTKLHVYITQYQPFASSSSTYFLSNWNAFNHSLFCLLFFTQKKHHFCLTLFHIFHALHTPSPREKSVLSWILSITVSSKFIRSLYVKGYLLLLSRLKYTDGRTCKRIVH